MSAPESPLLSDATRKACITRLERLRGALQKRKVPGLLVSNEKDIRYLTGFIGHDSLLLVLDDGAFIISDPRYDEFLDPWRGSGVADVVMGVRHRLEESVRELCAKRSATGLGFQAEHLSVARRDRLQQLVDPLRLVPLAGVVGVLRMRKDSLEISRIEQALRWQQEALRATLQKLVPGMTERQFAARLEFEMKTRGAFGPGFDSIIGSGPNSSVIHYQTGDTVIQPGVLLVDWGAATPDGYNGDMTRTFGVGAVGSMPEELRTVYGIVLEAQLAAIDAAAPGRTCAEIDAVARKIITDAGHGAHFGHGLGHGLGMDVHEEPFFNELQTDVTLEPGMVMTVEPGIYLPGVGGVRIEDDVLITDSGSRVLSDWPKGLDDMRIDFRPKRELERV